jgi:hypothetical protein
LRILVKLYGQEKQIEVLVKFLYIDGQWDAICEEVGLAGYGNSDLNIVRENVFDAIKFTLDTDEIEFTEKIISIEELG